MAIPEKSFCPSSNKEWREWLEHNHDKEKFVWVIYFKKETGIPSIEWSAAVDEALCFGWIDSKRKTLDDRRFMQFFTRRKPKSIWSKINKEKVQRLIDQGRMTSAGLDSIEVAKANGSWTLFDNVENLVIPDDLMGEFNKNPSALEYYETLKKSVKKGLLGWIQLAKLDETRQKRISEIVLNAQNNKLPKQFR